MELNVNRNNKALLFYERMGMRKLREGDFPIGNQLLVIGAILYESIPIWMTWTVFVVACTISMFTMIFMLKWLERVAK